MAGNTRIPLERLLQSQGFGSRKECRDLIRAGLILVDGRRETKEDTLIPVPAGVCAGVGPGVGADAKELALEVRGERWPYKEKLYLVMNKPRGYECSRNPVSHPSVFELLPPHFARRGVQPVGRLDWDTDGLLLLSDDGAFIHGQTAPKRHVPKTYLARCARPAEESLAAALRQGVVLRDDPDPVKALACRIVGHFEVELVLEEGKYHQVKRMIAAGGNHCEALTRVGIGGLTLPGLGLEPGEWRYLDPARLYSAVTE